jgi:hypothetical protein
MRSKSGGRILTFYSYKGGTGRSMALANVAWVLASNGRRVLAIDWDLEAPGLHRYFAPFLVDKDLTASEGMIDFVIDFALEAMTPEAGDAKPDWYEAHANILRYAASLDWDFGNGGTLDFIPAGRQGLTYSTRVNSFNWQNFYDRLGGGVFLEATKRRMRAEYDYVLIDSRTGVSDTSGICTVQMPDTLVVCYTLNNQSIEGAAAVAESVYEQRRDSVLIFPVRMRVNQGELVKLRLRRAYEDDRFRRFPAHLSEREREQYRRAVQIQEWPYFAYEEVLATFRDPPGETATVLEGVERLTGYLTAPPGGPVKPFTLVPPSEAQRDEILELYQGAPLVADPNAALSSAADAVFNRLDDAQQQAARRLLTRLVRLAGPDDVAADSRRRARFSEFDPEAGLLVPQLSDAGVLVIESNPAADEPTVTLASDGLVQGWKRLREWLDDDREFLLWRQRFQATLAGWERGGGDRDYLLRGAALNEARAQQQERPNDLNSQERVFISESVSESVLERSRQVQGNLEGRERERGVTQRSSRLFQAVLLVALVTVLALLFVYYLPEILSATPSPSPSPSPVPIEPTQLPR